MKIGELAQRAGISASAIRYYEQAGLMPHAERSGNGYRVYGESALERIRLIQIGQGLGFTLEAILAVTKLEGPALKAGLLNSLEDRLRDIEHMMQALTEQRASLERTRQEVEAAWAAGECPGSL
ncbi:MerR family DNA-binding transcriptional regulator [Massilia sp. UMI-21]|nr:MerR family DNA-binding transcriptional regulator [Massilia sp. UMI-21]